MTFRRLVLLVVPAVAGVALGCGGDDLVHVERIEKITETDAQSAPAGARLPNPVAVRLLGKDGSPVPRGQVRWVATASGGALSDSISVSDFTGRAQVDYVLPSGAPGSFNIEARIATGTTRTTTFVVSSTAAPQITSVTPAQFTGGDVITIQGTNLSASADAQVAGAPARATSASATTVTAVVPMCLTPGAVNLRLRVAGAYSNAFPAVYVTTGPTVNLAAGDYALIDPVQLAAGCATFPTAGALGAEYLLAPQVVNGVPGATVGYRLTGDSTVTLVVSPWPDVPEQGAADAFHAFLRRRELEISSMPNRPEPPMAAAAVDAAAAAAIELGDKRDFRVCNKFGCQDVPDFTRITASAKYVGGHLVIFQDDAAPAGGFSDAEFNSMGDAFDNVLYELDTSTFGIESDVDLNGKVLVLLSGVVNGITPREQCSTSVVTGFFYAIDLDPAFAADTRANQAELFYAMTPDPSGAVSCVVSKAMVERVVPATFIHEFQHMISYNQHVLVRRGQAEDVWLNEAMSHLAEELGGNKYREMGQQQTYSDYVIGDVFNAFQYLKTPGTNAVLFANTEVGSLAERGGGWLFLRWLVDRFGATTLRRMEETRLVGAANVAAAVGEPLAQLLGQWSLANYVSDLPAFTPQARLRYETWSFRTTYASLNQQQPSRYDRPFPLVPQVFNGGTFTAVGSARSGSGDYFRVVQITGQRGFAIRLTDVGGQPLAGNAGIRLNIVRIR